MNLAKKLKTYENALEFKSFIEDIKLELSKDKRKTVESVLEEDNSMLGNSVAHLLQESNVDVSDTPVVIDFLTKTVNKIDSFESVELTVAVDPSEELIREVFGWLQSEINEDIILKIDIDSQILGGVRITYKGKYLDLSLSSKLEELFKNKDLLKK